MSFFRRRARNILSLIGSSFTLLPINKKKIMMFSYSGKQYSCNPKYVTEALINQYGDQFKIVWALKDVSKLKDNKNIKVIKYGRIKYLYHLATSKVILTNSRTDNLFKKRKKQYYIQTWHSFLRLKHIEKDTEKNLSFGYINQAKEDSRKCDLLISGCRYSTEIFKRAFWYDGEILECGTPRNDLLINLDNEKEREIKEKIGIDKDKKVLLYAPTFRNNGNVSIFDLNFEEIKKALSKSLAGEWVVLLRLHPNLIDKINELKKFEGVIDVTLYDDIQEILAVSDSVISDYSSLIFDYGLTNRPCFLYTPDLIKYSKSDRKLYFDLEKLPFPKANDNEVLIKKIEEFDFKVYKEKLKDFRDFVEDFEKGNASKVLAEKIAAICS